MRIGELLIYEERLNIKPIISTAIQTLDKVFKNNNHEMRIVGGAVRDIALGKSPKDIDFATDATPDEMIAILDKAGISYKPTGLEHGTITAIIDREPFEITTLRADTETDGRHAEVEFVRSWEEDAKRRDLTYNAMSMDIDGNVYDYFNGMDDLQDKVSNFVGDAEQRIQEDYLRILRYFRFQGRLSAPNWNEDTLNAISSNVKGLQQISAERIWQEMSKVLAGKNVANVLDYMNKSGVSEVIGLSTNDLNKVKDKGNPIVALAQMGNTTDIAKRWKLSKNETVLLDFLVKNKNNTLDQKKVEDMIADGVDKEKIQALAELQGQSKMADHAVTVNVPAFPVTGADLIAKGMKPGPEMGATLDSLKQQWKQSNFTATKDDLLTEWSWKNPFKFSRPDVIGSKIGNKDSYQRSPIRTIKLPVGNLKKWMKEDSNLATQKGRLEYYLKQSIDDGMILHLAGLGKFFKGTDPLVEIVPERNGRYALHPDKWESTFYSLTNKDFKKIVHYKPTLTKAPTNAIVGDMALANLFYRTNDLNEQLLIAEEYKNSIIPYGSDISHIKMPEVIIPATVSEKITKNTSMSDVIKDFYKSDAPQFKGKSKKKKRQMAIAAKLSLDENQDLKNVN